jgi:hypothetical protein
VPPTGRRNRTAGAYDGSGTARDGGVSRVRAVHVDRGLHVQLHRPADHRRVVAFALFYSTLGVPIAWFADRANRVWIVAGALTLWSGMTALCGTANSALRLFLARMSVGVGEAGGIAPSYSIISDYYPPEKRARALAIYSFGIPIFAGTDFYLLASAPRLKHDWIEPRPAAV